MNKKMLLSGLLILVSIFLCACWDQRPIEDLALIAGIGVDLYPANSNLLNYSFVHPLFLEDKRQGEKIELIAANNFGQAIDIWQQRNSRRFAGGKVRVIAFGEDAAREGLPGLFDYLQLPIVDDNAFAVVVQQANELWSVKAPETERIAFHVPNMLTNACLEGDALRITVGTLVTHATALGIDPIVPRLTVLDEARISLDGAALFQDMKMVGALSQEEMRLLMALKEEPVVQITLIVGVSDELARPDVEMEVRSPKTRICPRLVDGKLQVSVDFSATYVLRTYDAKADLTDPEAVRAVTTDIESNLLIEMERLLTKLQELQVDPLGVGKRWRATSFKDFDSSRYREQWAEAQIELKVQLRPFRAGSLHKTMDPSR